MLLDKLIGRQLGKLLGRHDENVYLAGNRLYLFYVVPLTLGIHAVGSHNHRGGLNLHALVVAVLDHVHEFVNDAAALLFLDGPLEGLLQKPQIPATVATRPAVYQGLPTPLFRFGLISWRLALRLGSGLVLSVLAVGRILGQLFPVGVHTNHFGQEQSPDANQQSRPWSRPETPESAVWFVSPYSHDTLAYLIVRENAAKIHGELIWWFASSVPSRKTGKENVWSSPRTVIPYCSEAPADLWQSTHALPAPR